MLCKLCIKATTTKWVESQVCGKGVKEVVTGPSSVRTCYVTWATRSASLRSSAGEGLMTPAALTKLLCGVHEEVCEKPVSKLETVIYVLTQPCIKHAHMPSIGLGT